MIIMIISFIYTEVNKRGITVHVGCIHVKIVKYNFFEAR